MQTVQPFAVDAGIEIETDTRLREREMPLAESPQAHIGKRFIEHVIDVAHGL